MANHLHDGHRSRMRQRYFHDSSGLCEHELLELLLFSVLPRVNTNDLSHDLINRFGSFSAVLGAEPSQLMEVKGISSGTAGFLSFYGDLCSSYFGVAGSAVKLSEQGGAEDYFLSYFKESRADVCLAVTLSSGGAPVSRVSFSPEEISSSACELKRLASRLLRDSSERLIVGINHGSAILPLGLMPGTEDFSMVSALSSAFEPIGIMLEDCVICCGGKAFSMRQNGAFSF